MIFNLQPLDATATTHLTLRMCHRCVYKCRVVLDCHAVYCNTLSGNGNWLVYKLN